MYRRRFTLNLLGLPTIINASGLIAWGVLGIILFLIMVLVKDIVVGDALIGAVVGILLHFLVCLAHQAGHALGAKQTGYPMTSWMTYWLLSMSRYPKDEPGLPAEVHIRRALGGQYFSLPLFIIALLIGQSILPDHGVAGVLAVFFMIDTLTFSIGALVPTPVIETDGKTIMTWMSERNKQ